MQDLSERNIKGYELRSAGQTVKGCLHLLPILPIEVTLITKQVPLAEDRQGDDFAATQRRFPPGRISSGVR